MNMIQLQLKNTVQTFLIFTIGEHRWIWLIRVISHSLYHYSSRGTQHTLRAWTGLIALLMFSSAGWKTKAGLRRIGLENWATPAPAANCQITAIAGVFEDPATWGPPFKANKKAAQLKLDGAPTLIPKPAWLYCDTAAQGVSVKLISNKGWNGASDEEVGCQVDFYTSAYRWTVNDDDLTWPIWS